MITERSKRIVASFPVEYWRANERIKAQAGDVSEHGIFIRADSYLPRGELIDLKLHLPNGRTVHQAARVTHILPEGAARTVGRQAGMGLEFMGRTSPEILQLVKQAELEVPVAENVEDRRRSVLVADSSTPIFERLAMTLGMAGHDVRTAATGNEAIESCRQSPPDVVLVDAEIADMTAWELIKAMGREPRLAGIPVAVTGPATDDVSRLKAYRMGAKDYIQKPFTDEEICIRVARLTHPAVQAAARVALTGSLSDLSLAMLLSLLDFERKSGTLVLLRQSDVTRIFVSSGQVIAIEGGVGADPTQSLFLALDWREGSFEFTVGEFVREKEIDIPTQHLLLEHARLRDETETPSEGEAEGELDAALSGMDADADEEPMPETAVKSTWRSKLAMEPDDEAGGESAAAVSDIGSRRGRQQRGGASSDPRKAKSIGDDTYALGSVPRQSEAV